MNYSTRQQDPNNLSVTYPTRAIGMLYLELIEQTEAGNRCRHPFDERIRPRGLLI
ncbi:MAG: hypothetical protein MZV49_13420 [Rhodopseudomonas palustris]|nr:hypothetical protein [Rhodopseudomonas palustris]